MDGLLPFLQTLRIGKEPQLVNWETRIGTIKVGVFLPHKINVWFADELAAEEVAVREARPTDVLHVELGVNDGGKVVGEINPASTDWAWLSGVVREAFDPLAVNGPTYWRQTQTHHYSVFRRPDTGNLVLLISAARGDADLRAAFEEAYPELAESVMHTAVCRGEQSAPSPEEVKATIEKIKECSAGRTATAEGTVDMPATDD
jgi:hypothetical protein